MITIREHDNLLTSEAQCLVNAVNCEGFMGKGIAYQFKQSFPQNNQYYLQQCKQNSCTIGEIIFFEEQEKIIANFPTKNKWREKSKYEYIEQGLYALHQGIIKHNITSIAIPQLGCGNGGLEWRQVREMICRILGTLQNVQIILYGSSKDKTLSANVFDMNKATLSHLLLIHFKNHLEQFGKMRLQKAGFFYNIISGSEYFKFQKHKFGPYSPAITAISEQIKSSTQGTNQDFLALETTLYNRLVSNSVKTAMNHAKRVVGLLNGINKGFDLEVYATLLHIISLYETISEEDILQKFAQYPKHEIQRFEQTNFLKYLQDLENLNLIKKNILGYELCQDFKKH